MLQWFNKQTNSSSLSEEAEFEQQENQQLSVDSALKDEDYEFLFNQLLDGVAHGWHLGKIVKFFNNLEPRSPASEWVAWLIRFEKKIVFSNDPSQRRVGAIMMRFGELTQSDKELNELGALTSKIGKKLFLGDTAELIWEYDGSDRVTLEEKENLAVVFLGKTEVAAEAEAAIASKAVQSPDSDSTDLVRESVEEALETNLNEPTTADISLTSATERESARAKDLREAISPDSSEERETQLLEQATQDPDLADELELDLLVEEDKTSLSELDELLNDPDPILEAIPTAEPPTQNLDFADRPELSPLDEKAEDGEDLLTSLDELLSEPAPIPELTTPTAERAIESEDLASDSKPQEAEVKKNLLESLEAFTEQLTVLQDIVPESDSTIEAEPDLEATLVLPDTQQATETPLSVASFLEATKALIHQNKQSVRTPLSWQEFITLLEQDEVLAQQIARYLQVASHNPQDIIKAAVERLTKQEKEQLSPATLELVESWFHLGLKQASAEDFQGAIASWDKALKLNPNLSEAWHNRGSALGRLARYEEAIQSFNRAISITPKHDRAWNDRAHALYQLQKWEQAIESWNKAISIASDNYQFWYNRGCALEQLQRFEEAISSYEKALEIKPDFQPARTRYISLITENSDSSSN